MAPISGATTLYHGHNFTRLERRTSPRSLVAIGSPVASPMIRRLPLAYTPTRRLSLLFSAADADTVPVRPCSPMVCAPRRVVSKTARGVLQTVEAVLFRKRPCLSQKTLGFMFPSFTF